MTLPFLGVGKPTWVPAIGPSGQAFMIRAPTIAETMKISKLKGSIRFITILSCGVFGIKHGDMTAEELEVEDALYLLERITNLAEDEVSRVERKITGR